MTLLNNMYPKSVTPSGETGTIEFNFTAEMPVFTERAPVNDGIIERADMLSESYRKLTGGIR